MRLNLQLMESPLLPATNVLSLCADLVMSMREEKEIRLVLIVKPDTNASKVSLFCIFLNSVQFPTKVSKLCLKYGNNLQVVLGLKVTKKKMTSMIWTMSSIVGILMPWALVKLQNLCCLHALTLAAVPTTMPEFLHIQNMNPLLWVLKSHS